MIDVSKFYNKKTRRWQLRKFKEYISKNNLKESSLSFEVIHYFVKKKNLTVSDKNFIVEMGFFLEEIPTELEKPTDILEIKPLKRQTFAEWKLSSDYEILQMNKQDLIDNLQRIRHLKGDSPDRYSFTGSEDDYLRLRTRFYSMVVMEFFVETEISFYLVADYLTSGHFNHNYRSKKKYNLKEGVRLRNYVKRIQTVFLFYKKNEDIANMILESTNITNSYKTIMTYLKKT